MSGKTKKHLSDQTRLKSVKNKTKVKNFKIYPNKLNFHIKQFCNVLRIHRKSWKINTLKTICLPSLVTEYIKSLLLNEITKDVFITLAILRQKLFKEKCLLFYSNH